MLLTWTVANSIKALKSYKSTNIYLGWNPTFFQSGQVIQRLYLVIHLFLRSFPFHISIIMSSILPNS